MDQHASAKDFTVGEVRFGNELPVVLISGPCQIETPDHAFMLADKLSAIARGAGMPFVFKASYDKANRTSLGGKRGIGIEEGLRVLEGVRERFGCPVLTDIHDIPQAQAAAQAVDILQIPAFLSRQTDLLVASAKTGRAINVKKGQFLAPWDMANVAAKLSGSGNERIMLCERGASFGYNTLVTDFRGLPIMAETGYPVVFDATHSVQQPGGRGDASGGERRYAPVLARAAVAVGVAALFVEAHDDPDNAPSDGPNMLPLEWMPDFVATIKRLDAVRKENRPRA